MTETEARDLAQPLLCRLSRKWQREDEITAGVRYPNLRLFWAAEHRLVERRRTLFRRRWQIRLGRGEAA